VPRPRSDMRKIRDILRLTHGEGMSRHRVSVALCVPRATVVRCLRRAEAAGVTWPLPDGLTEAELEARLYPLDADSHRARPLPEWSYVHGELRRKGVTINLVWQEWKEKFPEGHQYSQFAELYRAWAKRLKPTMRQVHKAGEKTFLDYAGPTIPITDPKTGVVSQAQLFVAVLGASSYTYAEAMVSQELPHWVEGNIHACEYFRGVTEIWVPDNLLSGVTKAHRYEPKINRTFKETAEHYGAVVIPARSYKPRDKAKVEAAVLLAERWILACLRHRTFFSIGEANVAIAELLEKLNDKPFQKMEGSRRSLYEELERPVLRPLPARRYEYGEWSEHKVNIDYHIEVDYHRYSVPHELIHQTVEARLTATTVEVILRGSRVASHARSFVRGGFTTVDEHMPSSHRRYAEWTPARIERWAAQTGPNTAAIAAKIMASRPHPEQGFRSCMWIMSMGKKHGASRLEAAAMRALAINAVSARSIESILKKGLETRPLPERFRTTPSTEATTPTTNRHENVRGSDYYK